jgi:hypothetical protein
MRKSIGAASRPTLSAGRERPASGQIAIMSAASTTIAFPNPVVRRCIDLANADRRRAVTVAGPSGLEAMIALCREGFDHAEFVRQATCLSADGATDILMIVGRPSARELAVLLRRTCRLLGEGGFLVVELRHTRDDEVVRAALSASGLTIVATRAAGRLVGHSVLRSPALLRQAG